MMHDFLHREVKMEYRLRKAEERVRAARVRGESVPPCPDGAGSVLGGILERLAGLADGLADLLLTNIPYGAGAMSPAAACASWTRARQ